jgi:hypothetical protein
MKYTVHDKYGGWILKKTFRKKDKAIEFAVGHPIAVEVCVEVIAPSSWFPYNPVPHAETVWSKS